MVMHRFMLKKDDDVGWSYQRQTRWRKSKPPWISSWPRQVRRPCSPPTSPMLVWEATKQRGGEHRDDWNARAPSSREWRPGGSGWRLATAIVVVARKSRAPARLNLGRGSLSPRPPRGTSEEPAAWIQWESWRLSACASVVPLAAAAAAAGGEDVGADTIDTDTIDISKI